MTPSQGKKCPDCCGCGNVTETFDSGDIQLKCQKCSGTGKLEEANENPK